MAFIPDYFGTSSRNCILVSDAVSSIDIELLYVWPDAYPLFMKTRTSQKYTSLSILAADLSMETSPT